MTETKPHQFEKDLAYATGLDNRLLGQRVKEGQVLCITHISATFENCATTEYIVIGYWNGHAYVEIHKDKPVVAGDLVHWDGAIYLREGQYIYAYYADVAVGEVMKLRANGRYE